MLRTLLRTAFNQRTPFFAAPSQHMKASGLGGAHGHGWTQPAPALWHLCTTHQQQRSASSKAGSEVSGSTHFSLIFRKPSSKPRPKDQPVYSPQELDVQKTHYDTVELHAKVAFLAVKCMRTGFDILSRYKGPGGGMTKEAWLHRCIFLETVAGIPGFVAGMHRHLSSIGTMQLQGGQISTLFEEAENERMHLLIFMSMKRPGRFFRFLVTLTQGIFFNIFFIAYMFSPKTCHRFVGYLEEEAVHTYTTFIKDLETSPTLISWGKEPAALIGRNYYKLGKNGTVLDVIRCVRTDESHHRDTNHEMANSKSKWKNGSAPSSSTSHH